jgi:hypothetical protein
MSNIHPSELDHWRSIDLLETIELHSIVDDTGTIKIIFFFVLEVSIEDAGVESES